MEFCKECGGALILFENNNSGLCSSCNLHYKKGVSKASESARGNADLPGDAVFTYEDGKILLRSKEGWLLWSASAEKQTELNTVLKSAKLIYEIRKKRKKKS